VGQVTQLPAVESRLDAGSLAALQIARQEAIQRIALLLKTKPLGGRSSDCGGSSFTGSPRVWWSPGQDTRSARPSGWPIRPLTVAPRMAMITP